MKKYFVLLSTLLLVGFLRTATAQEYSGLRFDLNDTRFQEMFHDFDFKGQFAVMAFADQTNRYYLLDFSQFTEKFGKVYFMMLSFGEERIVNVDGDLTHKQIWFLSGKRNPEADILGVFIQLKEKTDGISGSWSAEEKSTWLKTNDKYK